MSSRRVGLFGLGLAVISVGVLGTASAAASERHFTYTYETNVLNPGDIELEPWSTLRNGRSDYYNRLDERLELEFGIVKGLQSALYWNFSGVGRDIEDPGTGAKRRASDFSFQGISSEWKYQFTNPVADLIGSALYLEATIAPLEAELELKALFDKRAGRWLGAFNVIGEYEWKFEAPGDTSRVLFTELDLGGAYFLTDQMTVGLEAREVSQFTEADTFTSSVLYAGPVFAYGRGSWWTAMTFMPQLAAFKGSSSGSRLDLDRHERMQARVVLGFHL